MIDLYWIYDLPGWLFATITILVYVSFSLAGLHLTRKLVKRLHKEDHSHNDVVSYYLAAVTVFYGITLGLVAVGTWNTFSATDNKVDAEAQTLGSLYRDVNNYQDPLRGQMRQDLRNYAHYIINVSWPLQRKGIIPSGSGAYLDSFQTHLMTFQPDNMSEQILQAEVFKKFNELVELRRSRLNVVQTHLPTALWAIVIIGGLICLMVSFFFDTRSFGMHVWMTCLFAGLLGLMVFLIATMDNPFRGEVSVSPKPIELLYQQMMTHK